MNFDDSSKDAEERRDLTNFGLRTDIYAKKAQKVMYRKISKNWDTLNYQRDCPTNGIVGFYSAILRSKDADRITNRVDTDQTAPRGAV